MLTQVYEIFQRLAHLHFDPSPPTTSLELDVLQAYATLILPSALSYSDPDYPGLPPPAFSAALRDTPLKPK
jgi:hypothetical protein